MTDFDLLHPALQYHIVNSLGWRELRAFQETAIRPALEGRHMLILAPTAGGKTEAALFPILSRMLEQDWRGLSLLYICPIKALMNNLAERLGRYFSLLGRRAALWHGDISASEKKRLLREPPDCLLITPESIEVILTSRTIDHITFLADIQAVIVDEIHAFAGDDRGWHLLAVLERSSRIANFEFQRIGLSATVGNPEELSKWFMSGCRKKCVVQKPDSGGTENAEVVLDYVGSLKNAAIVVSRLHRGKKRLVFVDSRAKAEKLGANLRDLEVTTHVTHSSLSPEQRLRAENAFAQGDDCVIVATSVLELGVDVGNLDHVIQIDAPASVGSFLQRLGRTGRRPGSRKNTLFLATSKDSLLRAAALIRLWEQGYVEPLTPPPSPYHVFSQQLMAIALQESGIGFDAWHDWISGFCKTAGLQVKCIEKILDFMIEGDILWDDSGILWFGEKGEKQFGYRNFREILSVIAGEPLISVKHGTKELGVIHPISFAAVKGENTTILMGGRSWEVRAIDWSKKTAYVEPAKAHGRSRWIGSAISQGYDVCQSVRNLLENTELSLRWSARATEQMESIRESMSWLEPGASVFLQDGNRTMWWTFAGNDINSTIAFLIKERLQLDAFPDSLAVKIMGDLRHKQIGPLIADLKNFHKTFDTIPVDENLIEALKFSRCLPKELGRKIILERMIKKDDLSKISKMPYRIIVGHLI